MNRGINLLPYPTINTLRKVIFLVEYEVIFETVKKGDLTKIKELVSKSPRLVNVKNKYGETPLHWAVFRGKTRISKFLMKNNADINAKDAIGDAPLDIAIKKGHTAIAQALKDLGAEKNCRK
jgi:uncharacterized protein